MNIRQSWRKYKAWQKRPFKVAPMSDEIHTCYTCGTEFKGNFCPRCGQSSKIVPKMPFTKMILLFIDVWGLGNRSMFRTLRDLIFRPGYMICDYLRGMHNAYFPPFKLLFLLTTLSVIIGHGWNLSGRNWNKVTEFKPSYHEQSTSPQQAVTSQEIDDFALDEDIMVEGYIDDDEEDDFLTFDSFDNLPSDDDSTIDLTTDSDQGSIAYITPVTDINTDFDLDEIDDTIGYIETAEDDEMDVMTDIVLVALMNRVLHFSSDYPAFFQILFMLFASTIFFIFYRKSKIIGRFSFHEFFIAMIYVLDMNSIYLIFLRFFDASAWCYLIVFLLYIIPLKQMTGFGWWKSIWRYFVSLILSFIALILVAMVTVLLIMLIKGLL